MAVKKWMGAARQRMERRGTVGSLSKQDPTPGDKGLSDADLRSLWAKAQRTNDTALKRKILFAANARKPPLKLSKSKEK